MTRSSRSLPTQYASTTRGSSGSSIRLASRDQRQVGPCALEGARELGKAAVGLARRAVLEQRPRFRRRRRGRARSAGRRSARRGAGRRSRRGAAIGGWSRSAAAPTSAAPAVTSTMPATSTGAPSAARGEQRGDDGAEDEHRRDVDRLRTGERGVPGGDVGGEQQSGQRAPSRHCSALRPNSVACGPRRRSRRRAPPRRAPCGRGERPRVELGEETLDEDHLDSPEQRRREDHRLAAAEGDRAGVAGEPRLARDERARSRARCAGAKRSRRSGTASSATQTTSVFWMNAACVAVARDRPSKKRTNGTLPPMHGTRERAPSQARRLAGAGAQSGARRAGGAAARARGATRRRPRSSPSCRRSRRRSARRPASSRRRRRR